MSLLIGWWKFFFQSRSALPLSNAQNIHFITNTQVTLICSAIATSIGGLALLGWILKIEALFRFDLEYQSMNPVTAIAVMCGGVALGINSNARMVTSASIVLMIIAGAKLGQVFGLFDWHVDQILFSSDLAATDGRAPSEMAVSTAIALFLISLSFFLQLFGNKFFRLVALYMGLIVVSISFFALVSYLLGLGASFALETTGPMALPTALAITFLWLGNFIKQYPVALDIFGDPGPAGALARTVLPLTLILPTCLGAFRLQGERAGLYDTEFGVALMVSMDVMATLFMLSIAVAVTYKADIIRRQRELAIADSEAQYRLAESTAKVGHWRIDILKRETEWSDEIFKITGYDKQYGTPHSERILDSFHPEDRAKVRMRLFRAVKTAEGWNDIVRIVRPDGEIRILNTQGVCNTGPNSKVTSIFGVLHDITDREKILQEKLVAVETIKFLQSELIHAQRVNAMGIMASTLAHELNQPLAAITNYASGVELMVNRGANLAELVDPVARIKHSAFLASKIIDKLRQMIRKGVVSKEPFIPDRIIIEAGDLASRSFCRDIKLEYDLRDGQPVVGDPIQIQQVIINLLKNASESRQDAKGTNIRILSEHSHGEVRISVEDDGDGLTQDALAHLFEAFSSSKDNGMGLGLSISRTIVEAHGGKIWAENRCEGGARFTFTLPLVADLPR